MTNQAKVRKIRNLFHFYRGLILDCCEQEMKDEKTWTYLRSRLLKQLSPEHGLESKVIEVVLSSAEYGGDCES